MSLYLKQTSCNYVHVILCAFLSDDWKAGDLSYWLDLQGSGKDALEHYLGGIEVNEIIVQLVEDAGNAAQVIPTENAIFFDSSLAKSPSNARAKGLDLNLRTSLMARSATGVVNMEA
jgi:hypothetical protein